jgi:hypothetical protein
VAVPGECALQAGADAVEHLELGLSGTGCGRVRRAISVIAGPSRVADDR